MLIKLNLWHLEELAKTIENTRAAQEAVKVDVEQLKEQMSQIQEALKALQSNRETSALPYQPRDQMIQIFPHYGLPLGYIPPLKEDLRQAYTQKAEDHIYVTYIGDENELRQPLLQNFWKCSTKCCACDIDKGTRDEASTLCWHIGGCRSNQ